MKALFNPYLSNKVRNIFLLFVFILIASFIITPLRAETADSIFTSLEQVLNIAPDSTFKSNGNKAYIYNRTIVSREVEVRVFFDQNPNYSDKNNVFMLVMKDFHGVGTYTLEEFGGNAGLYSNWYGNNDIGTLEGTVIVEEYDSASWHIKGSFDVRVGTAWKTSSGQHSKGTFRIGWSNSIVVKQGDLFDLEIGKSVNLDLTMLTKSLPVSGVNIFINDSIQTNGTEILIGKTDANGNIKYLIKTDKITKEKLYSIPLRAEKDGITLVSKQIKINVKFASTCYNISNKNGVVVFSICAVGLDQWELNDEEPTLTSKYGVTINDILYFNGSVTIDTVAMGLKADGELSLKNIPLPGGKKGDFSLGKGKFDIKLIGETGILTLFAFTGKEKGCKLFEGYEIDITDIKLLGGRNAHGAEISAKIKINGLTKTCGIIGGDESEFEIEGLVLSTVDGINLKGLKIKNLGLYYPGFCMEEFSFKYEKKEDVLSIGAKVKIPICTIGGGFQLAKGALDSIGWSLEVKYPPLVVFAPSTIGMSGFYGKIDGFAKNSEKPFGIKLGGIMCDAVVPIAYSFKVYGEYKQPAFFELGAEDISFFKTGDFWQVVGAGSISADLKKYLFKIKAELKGGTGDGEVYYFKGNGEIAYSKKTESGGLAGQLTGELTIPARDETKPERWMSKKLGLPYTASAYARFSYKAGKTISGEIDFGKDYGNVLYSMNFDKNYLDPDFLFLNIPALNSWLGFNEDKELLVENTKNIDIKSDTKFALIIRNDIVALQSSKLTDPDGIVYKSDVADKNVSYSLSDNKLEEYWTLIAPKVGTWKLAYTPLTPKDSIDVYGMPTNTKNNFSIIASQSAKNITISWDNSKMDVSDSVDIYFDNDTLNYDGEYFGTFPATAGKATIIVDESITDCNFYLFANLVKNTIIYPAYSSKLFVNPRAKYAAPVGIQSFYNGATGQLKVTWLPSTDPLVIGYIIKISDDKGLDSILTTVFIDQNSAQFIINGVDGKNIQMTSFTENGESGCPGFIKIYNDVAEEFTSTSKSPIFVYPNPASDFIKIQNNPEFGEVNEIQIVNLMGEKLLTIDLINKNIKNEAMLIDLKEFSNGFYYLKFDVNQTTYTEPFLIIK
jgi:hypothetical protein